MCFYEPLHEVFGSLDPRRASSAPDLVHRVLRHPPVPEGTFAEYSGLVRPVGGVYGFSERFAFERFHLPAEEEDADLEAYLASLAALAQKNGRRAVLGFSRSSLRVAWMRRRFKGLHMCVLRHPHEQWTSYTAMADEGNSYFLAVTVLVFVKLLGKRVPGLGSGFSSSLAGVEVATYQKVVPFLRQDDLYFIFYVLWWLGAAHARASATASVELGYAVAHERERFLDMFRSHDIETDIAPLTSSPRCPAPPFAAQVEEEARRWIKAMQLDATVMQGEADGEWIASPHLTEHLEFSGERGGTSGKGVKVRLSRIAASYRQVVATLLRAQLGGGPTRSDSSGRAILRWAAPDLLIAPGGRLLPTEAGGEVAVARDPLMAVARAGTLPFELPAGRNRIHVRFASEGPAAHIGIRVSQPSLSGESILPLTFRSLEKGVQQQELATLDRSTKTLGVVVSLHWAAEALKVIELSVSGEALLSVPTAEATPHAEASPHAIGTALLFSGGGNGCGYLFRGFSNPEPDGCWTIAPQADLAVPVSDAGGIIQSVSVDVRAFTHPVLRPTSKLSLWLDGQEVGSTVINYQDSWRTLKFPCAVSVKPLQRRVWISLVVDKVASPFDVGLSSDRRLLGICLRRLILGTEPESRELISNRAELNR